MTSASDHSGTPPAPEIDETMAERLLSGEPVPAELGPVAMVMQGLREVSAQPVQPTVGLAEQMAGGEFPPPAAADRQPGNGRFHLAAAVVTVGRLLAAHAPGPRLAGRLAAVGLAAALVSAGSAGFAGSLPGPVQGSFESVVESVTPYRFPTPGGVDQPDGPGDSDADPGGDPGADSTGRGRGDAAGSPTTPSGPGRGGPPTGYRDGGGPGADSHGRDSAGRPPAGAPAGVGPGQRPGDAGAEGGPGGDGPPDPAVPPEPPEPPDPPDPPDRSGPDGDPGPSDRQAVPDRQSGADRQGGTGTPGGGSGNRADPAPGGSDARPGRGQ